MITFVNEDVQKTKSNENLGGNGQEREETIPSLPEKTVTGYFRSLLVYESVHLWFPEKLKYFSENLVKKRENERIRA